MTSSPSPFEKFAEHAARKKWAAEREKRNRGMDDMFPEVAADEDPTGDERYTTRETIEWCKARAGVDAFDLDVAACEESHHAPRWYSKADNGLTQPWFGRVWCNPPYSYIAPWVTKTWAEIEAGRVTLVAMLIPATRTEQPWWQKDIEPYRDAGDLFPPRELCSLTTHFLPGRTSFARPGSGGVGQSGAPFGCVLLVFRRR